MSPARPGSPNQSGFLIAKIHQLSGRIFHARLKERGIDINPAQGRILFVLWQKDRIPISEVSEKTQLEKSTLTSMLDRLEKAGLIRRVLSDEDRRVILIERTAKNRQLQSVYGEVSHQMNEIFFAGFTRGERLRMEKDLQRALANLIEEEDK